MIPPGFAALGFVVSIDLRKREVKTVFMKQVNTFTWEDTAPGGKRSRFTMQDSIKVAAEHAGILVGNYLRERMITAALSADPLEVSAGLAIPGDDPDPCPNCTGANAVFFERPGVRCPGCGRESGPYERPEAKA